MPYLELVAYIEREDRPMTLEDTDTIMDELIDWIESHGLLMSAVSKYHESDAAIERHWMKDETR